MTKQPVGRYWTPAVGNREAEAYVEDGTIASFVPESEYRRKGYAPDFDSLPTEEAYRA